MIYNKIISFSLWGNNPKYCVGIHKNILLAYKHFPEWIIHVYYDHTVPDETLDTIEYYDNTLLKERSNGFGAFWRFEAMQPGTIVLSRDADSRLSERERLIVNDWLNHDSSLCCIRDHVNHYEFPIMAGMFGVKNGFSIEIFNHMKNYVDNHVYLTDQIFLRNHVWPAYENNVSIYGIKETDWMKESYKNIGKDFVGQTYDENDIALYEQ